MSSGMHSGSNPNTQHVQKTNPRLKQDRTFPFCDTFGEQANWTKFLSVTAFLGGGGLFLGAFGALFIDIGVFFFTLFFSVYCFLTGVLLFKLSKQITQYLDSHTIGNLQAVVRSMRSFFRFLAVSVVSVVGLAIIFVILFLTTR